MKLAYQAFDKSGRALRDVIEAVDIADATDRLWRQGLYVTEVSPAKESASSVAPVARKRPKQGSRLKNLTLFTRQLYVLVSTGTQVTQALHSLEKQIKAPGWQHTLGQIRQRVEEGDSLSGAMAEHPAYFDAIYCSLVAAGESSGKLPAMLDRLAGLTRQQLHVRNAIRGALIYPSLLIVVSISVLCLMLIVVLPRFAELFDSLDVPLPPTTVALLMLSDALRGYWWAGLLLVGGTVVGLRYWLKTPNGRRAFDTAMIRLPQLGKVTRSFMVARIARLLGILLDSHLPLLDVLHLVQRTITNGQYAALLNHAVEAVTRGEPISSAFTDERLVDSSVCEAMRSGEQSGKVGFVLLNIADFLDDENDVLIKALLSIMEPLILIVLGALVGLVAVSMFMPLFDLTAMTSGGPS